MRKISKKEDLLLSGVFLLPFLVALLTVRPLPKSVVHKTMNYGKYDIVIISRVNFPQFFCDRKLYAEIWFGHRQIHNYYIIFLDAPDDYDERIKDVSILLNTNEIKIEFSGSGRARSGKDVGLYRITED